MNRFDRTLQGILESVSATGSRRVGHGRFETVEPAEGQPLQRSRLVAGYVLAVALPAVTAAATIPLRGSHTSAAAVVLVLAVVIVAAIGTTGPALVAAVWAGVVFDRADEPDAGPCVAPVPHGGRAALVVFACSRTDWNTSPRTLAGFGLATFGPAAPGADGTLVTDGGSATKVGWRRGRSVVGGWVGGDDLRRSSRDAQRRQDREGRRVCHHRCRACAPRSPPLTGAQS